MAEDDAAYKIGGAACEPAVTVTLATEIEAIAPFEEPGDENNRADQVLRLYDPPPQWKQRVRRSKTAGSLVRPLCK